MCSLHEISWTMNAIKNSSHMEYTCDCLNLCCKERNVIHSMPRLTLYDHDVSLNVECNCRCGHLTLFMVMWMFRFEPNENRDVTQHCISLWFSSQYGVQLKDLIMLEYKVVTASTFAGEEHWRHENTELIEPLQLSACQCGWAKVQHKCHVEQRHHEIHH